jgi:hypothetical protein
MRQRKAKALRKAAREMFAADPSIEKEMAKTRGNASSPFKRFLRRLKKEMR